MGKRGRILLLLLVGSWCDATLLPQMSAVPQPGRLLVGLRRAVNMVRGD